MDNAPGAALKLYPELSAAALKYKLDKEIYLWYELRSINVTGCGKLVLEDALPVLVSSFGYSLATVYRILESGEGRFWDLYETPLLLGRRQVKIRGLSSLAESFGISFLSPPHKLSSFSCQGRGNKRAQLYASSFKPAEGSRKGKPISRESIKAATGVRPRQQRRYERAVRVKKVANFAVQKDGQDKLVPVPQVVSGKSKTWVKNRRLGNTYYCRALQACRGMVKRVNGELRQRSSDKGEARLLKRFFLSPRSLFRSPVRAEEAFLLVKPKDRLIRGRLEWCVA